MSRTAGGGEDHGYFFNGKEVGLAPQTVIACSPS